MVRFGVVLSLIFAVSVLTFSQTPGTGTTTVPTPSVGHDYIKALSETVDPASGSVSLRIAVPIPKGRGLNLPFSFAYDTNGVFFPPDWKPFLTGLMSSGGWSYTVPALGIDNESYMPGGTNVTCGYQTNFRFVDATGARRGLGLFVMRGTNPACAQSFNTFAGGDIAVNASYSPSSGIAVADVDGTVYTNFSGFSSGTAGLIEDRNGNQISVTASGSGFTETDTLGRPLLSSSGFGVTGNTVTVSGGGSYQLTWESPSYNFTLDTKLVFNGNTSSCTFGGSASGTRSVVKSIQLPNGKSYNFKYGTDDPNNSNPYGLISQITYPSGGWIKYNWGDNSQSAGGVFPDLAGQVGQCYWRWGKPSLKSRTISFDGVNPALKQTYQYSTTWGNSTTYLWGRKQTTVTTQDLIRGTSFVTTYLYTPNSSTEEPTPVYIGPSFTVDPQIPVEQTITYKDTGGSTLEIVNKTWHNAVQLQSEQDTFGSLTSQKTYAYGGGSGGGGHYSYPGDQLIEEDEFDFGQTTPSRKTINTYQLFASTPIYPSQPTIFDKPCKTIVSNGSGTPYAETDYFYDNGATTAPCGAAGTPSVTGAGGSSLTGHDATNYPASSPSPRGNLTQKTQWLNTGGSPVTTYSYDETGQVVSVIDPKFNTTSYSYSDSFVDTDSSGFSNTAGSPPHATVTNAYITTVTAPPTNGVNHITTYAYGYNDGQLTESFDQNKQKTTFKFNDSLDRLTEIDFPALGQTTYFYNDTAPISITTTKLASPSPNVQNTLIFDGMGNTRKTELLTDPDGVTYTRTAYDGLGRVYQSWNPTRCDPDVNPTSCTGETTYGITTYTDDALGRTKTVLEQDGSAVSTAYDLSQTDSLGRVSDCKTVTDEAGNQRRSCFDGLGRLTSAWEAPSTLNYETDYTYDVLNALLSVTQKGGAASSSWRTRTFTYDSLSRLGKSTNPESGAISYTYDANGNVLTKTAPLPNQTGTATVNTSYTSDALNRLTLKTYSDGTPSAVFNYDEASAWGGQSISNGIGRMTTSGNSPAAQLLGYDPVGRVNLKTDVTPTGGFYRTTFGYDAAGDLISQGGPSIFNLAQTFDGAERPTQLTSTWSDAQHPATLISVDASVGYDAFGGLHKATLGNGLAQSNVYNTRLQPCLMELNSSNTTLKTCGDGTPGGNVLDFYMSYTGATGNNGNLVQWNGTGAQSFIRVNTYDPLNRLFSMSDSGSGQVCKGLQWVYDAWGNRLQQNTTAGSCFSPVFGVYTNNRISGAPYQYDSAGNMIADGNHTYSYDAENELTKVDGGTTATYYYDVLGRRVGKQIGSGVITEYLRDLAGNVIADKQGSNWATFYLYFGGALTAEYTASTTEFIFRDHLGSTRLLTAMNQSVLDNMDYLPFGEQTSGDTATTHKFTGKERDSESGLDNFGKRYDASTMGRFMTADAFYKDGHVGAPQSWNEYAYTRNNPLKYTDPTGEAAQNLPLPCNPYAAPCQGGSTIKSAQNLVAQLEEPERDEEEVTPQAEAERALEPVEPQKPEPNVFDWMHPGPLSNDIAKTFSGGRYVKVEVGEEGWSLEDARVFGGKAEPEGKDGTFYSPTPQKGGLQSQIDLGLRPEWGNTTENTASVYLKPGTVVYVGNTASQGGIWVGGTIQIYVPK
jgi:RHS repeat-associated protein